MTPRPYQITAHAAVSAAWAAHRGIILHGPTGSGKTVQACMAIRAAVGRGKRVLFLAHRGELLAQCSAKLTAQDIPHGWIMAGRTASPAPVQLATIQTISRRTARPQADLIVIDECHHVASESYQRLLAAYPSAYRLGLTATPYRLDGQGLRCAFTHIVQTATVSELVAGGWLVPFRVFTSSQPISLSGVHRRAGDYATGDAAGAVDKPHLVADVVKTWLRLAKGRPTVCFGTLVSHSEHMVGEFRAAGVRAVHVDGETPAAEREAAVADLAAGRLDVLSNCMLFTEGLDVPPAACVILARPTASRCLWRQMVGRGSRPAPGKQDCIVLDHACLTASFGLPEDEDDFTLDGVRLDKERRMPVKTCPSCFRTCPATAKQCPECGHVFDVVRRELPWVDKGELTEAAPVSRHAPEASRKNFYQRNLRTALSKGYKPGWASMRYRAVFGAWPPSAWAIEVTG